MNKRAQFDLDLAFGEAGEQWLIWLADEAKVEVKRERDLWWGTGNLFFEFESRGKPSGLAITAASFWVIVLSLEGSNCGALVFPVPALKLNLKKLLANELARIVSGGDDNTSRGVLVKLSTLQTLFGPNNNTTTT